MGAWSKSFADYKRLNTLVDVIRVPKVRTSGELLPIDTIFVSILLLVSVLFLRPSRAKANYKGSNLRKIGNKCISDVATASVHSEKTRMKKLMKMIIIIIITEKPFTSK